MDGKRDATVEVEFAGEQWRLLPQRAVYWPRRRTLLVSDLHLGKGATFRAAGVPVPAGSTEKDLQRLTDLLTQTEAQRLVMLGDLLHAKSSRSDEVNGSIAAWRARHQSVEMLLVRGNHDRAAGRIPSDWDVQEIEEGHDDEGILLCHAPCEQSPHPVLAGHIHPVFLMRDFDRSTVRSPCFVFDETCAILPSFGSLTGGHPISPRPGRRIFIATGSRVVPVPAQ